MSITDFVPWGCSCLHSWWFPGVLRAVVSSVNMEKARA